MNAIQKELSLNVTPAQLNALLVAYLPRNLPVLITGAPGVGKSDIVAQATNQLGFDLVISHPVTEDPTDPKGLPFPAADGTSAHFLPFGNLDKILKATRSTVWFLDDLGQASPAVQAAYMQLLLARRVGEHVLPDCITFVAATNRRTDNAGVSGILDPVISRFATVVNVVPDIQSWSAWAVRNDMPYERRGKSFQYITLSTESFFLDVQDTAPGITVAISFRTRQGTRDASGGERNFIAVEQIDTAHGYASLLLSLRLTQGLSNERHDSRSPWKLVPL